MNDFQIVPSKRESVKPLIGVFGASGSGKTYSSLLFARGLVGPKGRIVLIDTENKRGQIYSDIIPSSYSVIDFDTPFSPSRYEAAIVEAEKNADVIVVDSMSHEWSGEGGVLDMQEAELQRMAGNDYGKREACKMAAWIKPKGEHKQMVQRLLRCRVPLICCLRGEEKTHITKDGGKTKVVTDDFTTPLFDKRFIFEMLISIETVSKNGVGGFTHILTCHHPALQKALPGTDEQLGVKHGEAVAVWCSSPGKMVVQVQGLNEFMPEPTKTPSGDIKALKGQLWKMTEHLHRGVPAALEQFLTDEAIISDTEAMADLTADRLTTVIEKAKAKLGK